MHIAASSSIVKFYEWPNGELLYSYKPQSNVDGPNRSISWGKDGTWLAIVPRSGHVEIISVKECIRRLHTIKDIPFPTCAAFQNNTKKNIAVADSNGQVFVYDMKTKNIKQHFNNISSPIFYLEYTPKDSHIVAACENGEVALFSNLSSNLSCILTIPKSSSVTSLRCHPSRKNFIVGGGHDGIVAVWDINTNKTKYFTKAHDERITGVAFSPLSCALIVTLGLDRQFSFFDIVANTCVIQIPVDTNMTAVDFTPDGKSIGMASEDGRIFVYDTRFMNTPRNCFISQESPINQLLFKKISQEQQDDINEDNSDVTLHRSSSIDSFCVGIETLTSDAPNNLHQGGDSVMEVLRLSLSGANQPRKHDDHFHVEILKKGTDAEFSLPTLTESIHQIDLTMQRNLLPNTSKQQTSSCSSKHKEEDKLNNSLLTCLEQNKPSTATDSTVTANKLQKLIRSIVKDVISEEMDRFRKNMNYELQEVTSTIRHYLVDMQMSLVKEFVQVENNLHKIKEELFNEEPQSSDGVLMEENYKLRTELALLREKLNR